MFVHHTTQDFTMVLVYVDDILIVPSWEEVKEEDKDKMILHIDPGTAFGTGMHETTQLCIRQLKKFITPETELTVMNLYNTYYTEGFILALHFDEFAVAIEPSALDGIKGQGDVFVYAMTKNAIYKDFGSRYFDVAAILKYYRG